MQIIKVELLNDNALKLLQLLEQLRIIKLASTVEATGPPKRRWAGTLSKETAAKMIHHLEQSRSEWERI